jgi:putative transcriptional regulator
MPVLRASIAGVVGRKCRTAAQRTQHLHRRPFAAVIFALGLLAGISGKAGQEDQSKQSQGLFLAASRSLSDPLFANSVVLMLPIKESPLLAGLIVNKPTRVPLRDLFADSPALQKRDATAYFGGPVDVQVGARSAIFRSEKPPKNATLVFGDVYVTFDPGTIAALVENVQQASVLRVFVGRAQWAPAQLQNEMAKGAWYGVRSDANPIFSKSPDAAWHMLLNQAEPKPIVRYEPPLVPFSQLVLGTNGRTLAAQ